VSLSTIERCYRQLMSNFADANIVFAGNVDLDVLKPLVEKYIGSLPVGKVATKEVDHNLEIEKGDIYNTFEIEMTTPKTSVVLTYSAMMPYTPENNYLMSSLSYILNMIYTETLREGEGGTYGASEQADITLVPKQQASLLVQFDTDPERANRMIEIACQAVEDLAKNGPTEEQMEKAKQNLLKNLTENRISNSYWLSAEVMYYKYNIDSDTEAEALINSLTADNVKNIAAQLVNSGNFVKVVMNPKFVD
ncbi:MAG: insulinase family protein, partial [Bacteroidales bacterium]|nr:insulinase family protein [Bacteroidales bacterium]